MSYASARPYGPMPCPCLCCSPRTAPRAPCAPHLLPFRLRGRLTTRCYMQARPRPRPRPEHYHTHPVPTLHHSPRTHSISPFTRRFIRHILHPASLQHIDSTGPHTAISTGALGPIPHLGSSTYRLLSAFFFLLSGLFGIIYPTRSGHYIIISCLLACSLRIFIYLRDMTLFSVRD
ncbi:hypothetical protein DFH09DRAFT_1135405 [Mycena vulgaris]|nr:hypothetical protein DFH09DRAFT_1135405 [Mycena vulgaris]